MTFSCHANDLLAIQKKKLASFSVKLCSQQKKEEMRQQDSLTHLPNGDDSDLNRIIV